MARGGWRTGRRGKERAVWGRIAPLLTKSLLGVAVRLDLRRLWLSLA